MRGVQIFTGTSHPALAETICERLGTIPAQADLGKFSNGETRVNINVSVRNQDVYIVQSGSSKINDSVMELLVMINACKGGSARSITAGVDHVVTLDLHASQMQGFFGKPVDNLFAEPFIARWIRMNVPGWKEAVVVSKNAGGTKRVTSLADTLKLNFGIVTTDRRRPKASANMADSSLFFDATEPESGRIPNTHKPFDLQLQSANESPEEALSDSNDDGDAGSASGNYLRPETPPGARRPSELEAAQEQTDVRVCDVVTGRIVQGQLVDDDYPSAAPGPAPTSVPAWIGTTLGPAMNQASMEHGSDPM
ncbi:ribose-phosphate pyrophosphokinase 1, partial [Elasticomyces elasticus]